MPFYAIQRVTIAVNAIGILQRENLSQPEFYLYGDPSLGLIDNTLKEEKVAGRKCCGN